MITCDKMAKVHKKKKKNEQKKYPQKVRRKKRKIIYKNMKGCPFSTTKEYMIPFFFHIYIYIVLIYIFISQL